jgi:hypothetical protein
MRRVSSSIKKERRFGDQSNFSIHVLVNEHVSCRPSEMIHSISEQPCTTESTFNLCNHQHQLHASKLRAHTSIRNALNLDGHTLGQLLNRNTAARRLVREVLLVHAVHLGKVCHVVEEDVDLVSPVSALFDRLSTHNTLGLYVGELNANAP